MSDEKKIPEVAKRRGGADTLFSAEWFDENDDFGGKKAEPQEAVREQVSIPAGGGDRDLGSSVDEAPARSGPSMGLVVVGLAVLFLGGGCLIGAIGGGGVFALGLAPL